MPAGSNQTSVSSNECPGDSCSGRSPQWTLHGNIAPSSASNGDQRAVRWPGMEAGRIRMENDNGFQRFVGVDWAKKNHRFRACPPRRTRSVGSVPIRTGAGASRRRRVDPLVARE